MADVFQRSWEWTSLGSSCKASSIDRDFFKHLIKIAMSQSRLKHAHRVLQETLWKTGDSGMVFLVHGSLVVGTCAGEPILTEHQAFQTLRVACGVNPAEHCGGDRWG